jgi:hypothetical protein
MKSSQLMVNEGFSLVGSEIAVKVSEYAIYKNHI